MLAAGLEVALERRAPGPDLVGPLERVHPLGQGTLRSQARRGFLAGDCGGDRHGRRLYTRTGARRNAHMAIFSRIQLDLDLRLSERLTLPDRFGRLCRQFSRVCGADAAFRQRVRAIGALAPLRGNRARARRAIRAPAAGSRKLSVPTATHVAPAREEIGGVAPGRDAAHADHRDLDARARPPRPAASAIGAHGRAGDARPCRRRATARRVRGCERHALERVDQRHRVRAGGLGGRAPPPPDRSRWASASRRAASRSAGAGARPRRRSPPGRRP